MGQQQLLLVILVTIIVGIATVVAINTFGSAADSANLDAVRQDIASIAASAQGYYMKPGMLGGGGQDFTNVNFKNIAFGGNIDETAADPLVAWNENGRYVISARGADNFTLTGHPASGFDSYSGSSDTDPGGTASDPIEVTVEEDGLTYSS